MTIPIVTTTFISAKKTSAITYTNIRPAQAGRAEQPTSSSITSKRREGDGGYQYKASAITQCAKDFSQAINAKWLAGATLVPVPPSKNKADPLFDDRMVQVCRGIRSPGPSDVREIIEQINSTDTFKGGQRQSPDELQANYRVVANELAQARPTIGVVDDVLTTGSHFKAVKAIILDRAI